MGTVVRVPQTRDMIGEELSGDEAWAALRTYGGRKLLTDAFLRFRYADGFSFARALAFQFVLALVPFSIALVGVATSLHTESVGRVVELTLTRIAPGPSAELIRTSLGRTEEGAGSGPGGELAVWLGLAFATLNLASAMAQIERGANRIYGVERDRPFLAKYARALVLVVAAGLPLIGGFLVLVGGKAVGSALAETFGWGEPAQDAWGLLRIPVGILLTWLASAVLFRWAPRRDQPGYTWLAFGSAVHLLLWVGATWLLTLYVGFSGSFGSVYGPLTAFVALLLWSNLAGISLFLGLSLAAQLESARAGQHDPVHPDPGHGGDPDHV
ncbi:YihY/virulence factor BrkB family protein [Streptomyces sp. NBC_01725]|uniref:YihY/virulence factor BrkB family protein n=1 Tax=unclassified Streptomyces TaxID=2593676 RepID=UPI0011C7EF7B|nr:MULTISPECIES: YihY/virulence factor BrkB family protein [unclassified Streptomyces]TXL88394.1 YihY/virulence factor BrkB family protein [Streptomyces sp. IB2014 016-6]